MTIESHIISLTDNATASQIEGILRTLIGTGGKIEMTSGRVIIASFDNIYVDVIRQKPGVRVVGGVNFRGRTVKKIVKRVPSKV